MFALCCVKASRQRFKLVTSFSIWQLKWLSILLLLLALKEFAALNNAVTSAGGFTQPPFAKNTPE